MSTLNVQERVLLHGSVQKTLENVEFTKQSRKDSDVLQFVERVYSRTRGLVSHDADYKRNNMRVFFYGLGFSVFAAQNPTEKTDVSIIVKNNDTDAIMKLRGNNYMPVVMHRLENGVYVLLVLDTKKKTVTPYKFDKITRSWPSPSGSPQHIGGVHVIKLVNDTAEFKNWMGFVKTEDGKYKSYFQMAATLSINLPSSFVVEYTDSTVTFVPDNAGFSKEEDNLSLGDKIQHIEQSPAIVFVMWNTYASSYWKELMIRFWNMDRDYKVMRLIVRNQLDRYGTLEVTGFATNCVDQVLVEMNGYAKAIFHRNYLMCDDPVDRN